MTKFNEQLEIISQSINLTEPSNSNLHHNVGKENRHYVETPCWFSSFVSSSPFLLCTNFFFPLQSSVSVWQIIEELRWLLGALPLFADHFVSKMCNTLMNYRETCQAAYRGITQPDSEDKRIISATWAKDEDISRFLRLDGTIYIAPLIICLISRPVLLNSFLVFLF